MFVARQLLSGRQSLSVRQLLAGSLYQIQQLLPSIYCTYLSSSSCCQKLLPIAVVKQPLPNSCCQTAVAKQVLPNRCCQTAVAKQVLPNSCCQVAVVSSYCQLAGGHEAAAMQLLAGIVESLPVVRAGLPPLQTDRASGHQAGKCGLCGQGELQTEARRLRSGTQVPSSTNIVLIKSIFGTAEYFYTKINQLLLSYCKSTLKIWFRHICCRQVIVWNFKINAVICC